MCKNSVGALIIQIFFIRSFLGAAAYRRDCSGGDATLQEESLLSLCCEHKVISVAEVRRFFCHLRDFLADAVRKSCSRDADRLCDCGFCRFPPQDATSRRHFLQREGAHRRMLSNVCAASGFSA